MWSEWFKNNMQEGAPWMMLSPGEEAHVKTKASSGKDPLLSVVEKAWEANPLQSVLPINWVEITRSLQTLWMREMRDPARATERAMDYNMRAWSAAMESWNKTVSRLWGIPVEEDEGSDSRFSAPEWETNPYYHTLKETYNLASEYLLAEAEETDGDVGTEEQRRLRFHLKQFVDAMAPVNFLLTNPAALRRVVETGGASVAEGTRNLLSDVQEGKLTMTDINAFEPGENLAITPGKVVYRNELIELIQYEPQTEKVHEIPMVWMPPWINKYYILDMQPKNSFVKYMVEQGYTLFVVSWKNPDASMDETTFEDYMHKGPLAAAEVVRDITGSETVNPMGYCIGGTLLAMTLAYLEAKGENKFGPATFMVSLQDFSEVGDTSVFVDDEQIDFMERQMLERGYLDSSSLYNMFNLLRSNDLIWSNVVNNYLMGQKPPSFDLLYWNSDNTRMTRNAHSFYMRNTYLENNLVEPGKVKLDDVPIDLSRIKQDVYAVGAEKDHIVPWKSAWRISQLVSGNTRFIMANSGHIAGIINHPGKGKGNFWTNDAAEKANTPEEWFETTEKHEGSWWTDWAKWLSERSGKKKDPPKMGSEKHPPLEDAPGTYVKER
ncbi:MAG: class I poly(R)-hydroxyalkanoic acid synthase [Rubrobacter sp.]|nr:class I poly(R)-hydroxyalkanoic acid synthase [Rubrobacter sp.]